MNPPDIVYMLEVRTRSYEWDTLKNGYTPNKWGNWSALDGHTYFDRRTARHYRKTLDQKATSTFAQDCECRIAVFDRRVPKPATFADVTKELKRLPPDRSYH